MRFRTGAGDRTLWEVRSARLGEPAGVRADARSAAEFQLSEGAATAPVTLLVRGQACSSLRSGVPSSECRDNPTCSPAVTLPSLGLLRRRAHRLHTSLNPSLRHQRESRPIGLDRLGIDAELIDRPLCRAIGCKGQVLLSASPGEGTQFVPCKTHRRDLGWGRTPSGQPTGDVEPGLPHHGAFSSCTAKGARSSPPRKIDAGFRFGVGAAGQRERARTGLGARKEPIGAAAGYLRSPIGHQSVAEVVNGSIGFHHSSVLPGVR